MATKVKHSSGIHFEKAKCMGKTDDNGEIECTTTAAMVIVNGDAYVLKYLYDKDNHNPSTAILYLVKDISGSETHSKLQIYKTVSKVHKYVFFKHLNSITYYNSKFYIVDLKRAIYRLSMNGHIEREYTLDSSMTAANITVEDFATIEHYSGDLFILGGKKNNKDGIRKYWIVQIDEEKKLIIKKGSFRCSGCAAEDWFGNDICYDVNTKLFYITLVYKKDDVPIENKIFTYDLSKLNTDIDYATAYQPTRILCELINEQKEERIEYEGMSIWNNKKYVVIEQNLIISEEGKQDDAIAILSKVKN